MAVNKVIYGGTTIIDLTDATAVASDVAYGKYFYGNDGVKTQGTSTKDSDTTDANAAAAEILSGRTAYVNKNKITGEMPNRGAVTATISNLSPYTIQNGFHDGSGTVAVNSTNIEAGNIKSGITILGVQGTYTGEAITTQTKTITPTASDQVITADTSSGYDYLAQVTVKAIPYTETANTYGITVTIG